MISRNSSFTYKGQAVRPQDVGRDLGVAYMVEGSVRRAANRVRVTAQLVETRSGEHLLAERYDRELEDIFAVQDEITRAIAAAIEPELGNLERERARSKPLGSLTAWDWYQRAVWYSYHDTEAAGAEALRHCRRAIEESPDFSPPYALAADVLTNDLISGFREPSGTAIDEALALAEQAIRLDDKDAFAHMILGRIKLLQCKHADSVAELRTAVALNPSFAEAYHALGFSLIFSGQPEDAVPQFDMAIRLSPFDPSISSFHEMRAWALLVQGKFEEAAKAARISVSRPHAQHWAYATLTAALGHIGELEEAARAREQLMSRKPDFSAAFVRRFVYYNENPAHLELYIDGLRKAGLTE